MQACRCFQFRPVERRECFISSICSIKCLLLLVCQKVLKPTIVKTKASQGAATPPLLSHTLLQLVSHAAVGGMLFQVNLFPDHCPCECTLYGHHWSSQEHFKCSSNVVCPCGEHEWVRKWMNAKQGRNYKKVTPCCQLCHSGNQPGWGMTNILGNSNVTHEGGRCLVCVVDVVLLAGIHTHFLLQYRRDNTPPACVQAPVLSSL